MAKPTRRHACRLTSLCLALFLFQGACTRPNRTIRGADELLAPGSWTIDGVRPGLSFEQIQARFGEPDTSFGPENARGHTFSQRSLTVECDSEGTVSHVYGRVLEHNGKAVLRAGDPGPAVVSTLGEGYIIKRYSPKGSVIATGSVPNGADHYHRDETMRLHVLVNREGTIGGFDAAPLDRLPSPRG